ncbi:MAG: c-type cytochrome, partial [Verrucomicrobia bacterium]|nr:c-type cytochrome [Verrucomicrobiota bacterium]
AHATLKSAGPAAVAPVAALLQDENPYVRARAVWVLSEDAGAGLPRVAAVLDDADPQLRVVAFRALRRAVEQGRVQGASTPAATPGTREHLLATARRLAADPSPAVRREVAVMMRDEPFSVAGPVLVALAAGYRGDDRMLLEAWGVGATGKEAALYAALRGGPGSGDPIRWTPAFTDLAWRLHPEASVPDFRARALEATLGDTERKRALTALGFNASPEAARAVLEVAAKAEGVVKAEAVWWLINRKDSQWKAADLDAALKAQGVYDPDAVAWIEATVPVPESPKYAAKEVLALNGDASKGGEKFTAVCASCHRAGDVGTEYAPNLTGWASRQGREVLVNSVLQPGAEIASGFNGTEVTTKDGTVIHGLLLSEGDPLILQSAGGLTQMVPKKQVAGRKGLDRSLMMSADQLGLTAQDLADIAAYLQTH